jgi:hypothetical protein
LDISHRGRSEAKVAIILTDIRDLLGHHSVTLTEKYYAHLAPNNLSEAVRQLEGVLVKKSLPNSLPNCTESGNPCDENCNTQAPLTDSADKGYIRFSSLSAGVAKLAYAADSKSRLCIFCPLVNCSELFETERENDFDALKPFAGILANFEAF